MRTIHYVGIDPGQSGGLILLSQIDGIKSFNDGIVSVQEAIPMPSTERDIWEWFSHLPVSLVGAAIEKVHSMPQQGVASTFKFGVGYGGLRMALIAVGVPFESVTPQAGQKGLGIPKRKKTETPTQWKNRLKSKAQELFPKITVTLKIADALLIAEYYRRKHKGIL